ncbi:MAG: cryptochrome/photolyase family protein [Armatimonadota bacterium]
MAESSRCAVVWFRRGLRVDDHRALRAAVDSGRPILPLFILDRRMLDDSGIAPARIAFLFEGLRALDARLQELGARLIVREGDPARVLGALASEGRIAEVHHGTETEPWGAHRDGVVADVLRAAGVRVIRHEDHLVRPAGSIRTEAGLPYRVFTPFRRAWSRTPFDVPLDPPASISMAMGFDSLPLPEPVRASGARVPAGEVAGMARWRTFLVDGLSAYDEARDFPARSATSGLSPHLKFGMVSPRRLVREALSCSADAASGGASGAATFVSELCWRDFYHHVLAAFPQVAEGCFRPEFDALPWENDETLWRAWEAGSTGYPIVDAAMRELAATGSMHNRARMIVASFLSKDLLVDWRHGERHFMAHLIDGDLAANNGGWQWAAGTGTDAQPWFRIFNPVAQGERFDPDGSYVRGWVPELGKVPSKRVHCPWLLSAAEQSWIGLRLGIDYPAPVVNHARQRERALALYRSVASGGAA